MFDYLRRGSMILGFVVGMFVGASFGILLIAFANVSRENDRE